MIANKLHARFIVWRVKLRRCEFQASQPEHIAGKYLPKRELIARCLKA